MPIGVCLVAFLHLWFYKSIASLHDRHVTRMTHLPKKAGLGHHPGLRVWRHWVVVCVPALVRGKSKKLIH
eukprot:2788613-Amphidinium_carterae.1